MTAQNHSAFPSSVSTPMKDSTRWPLLLILLGNSAVFYGAVKTGSLLTEGVLQLAQDWRRLLPAGGGFVLVSIFNELFDSNTKARLVFWRWNHPLPGSRAFSKYAASDPRINIQSLEHKYRPFPSDPHAQNALWYRLYRNVASDSAVNQVHRKYLFTRDYAVGSFLLVLTLGMAGFWAIPVARQSG